MVDKKTDINTRDRETKRNNLTKLNYTIQTSNTYDALVVARSSVLRLLGLSNGLCRPIGPTGSTTRQLTLTLTLVLTVLHRNYAVPSRK